jgi:hypothetical protein
MLAKFELLMDEEVLDGTAESEDGSYVLEAGMWIAE